MDDFIKQLSKSIFRDTAQRCSENLNFAPSNSPLSNSPRLQLGEILLSTFVNTQIFHSKQSFDGDSHCWTVSQKLISDSWNFRGPFGNTDLHAPNLHERWTSNLTIARQSFMDLEMYECNVVSSFDRSLVKYFLPKHATCFARVSAQYTMHNILRFLELSRYIVTHAITGRARHLSSRLSRDTKDRPDNSAPGHADDSPIFQRGSAAGSFVLLSSPVEESLSLDSRARGNIYSRVRHVVEGSVAWWTGGGHVRSI
jgi:hypothetical protein